MLDRALFSTVYYWVTAKTRRVHSLPTPCVLSVLGKRSWHDAWTPYVSHVIDTGWVPARMERRRRCELCCDWKNSCSFKVREMLNYSKEEIRGDSKRFDGLSIPGFGKLYKVVRYDHYVCFLAKPHLETTKYVIPTHYHKVTH